MEIDYTRLKNVTVNRSNIRPSTSHLLSDDSHFLNKVPPPPQKKTHTTVAFKDKVWLTYMLLIKLVSSKRCHTRFDSSGAKGDEYQTNHRQTAARHNQG